MPAQTLSLLRSQAPEGSLMSLPWKLCHKNRWAAPKSNYNPLKASRRDPDPQIGKLCRIIPHQSMPGPDTGNFLPARIADSVPNPKFFPFQRKAFFIQVRKGFAPPAQLCKKFSLLLHLKGMVPDLAMIRIPEPSVVPQKFFCVNIRKGVIHSKGIIGKPLRPR